MEYRQTSQKVLNRYQPQLLNRQRSTDKLVGRLQARNREMEDYSRLQERLACMEEQYTQLLRQSVLVSLIQETTRVRMEHQSRQAQQTAQELRSTIEMRSGQMKSLTIRLNDLLGEADELTNMKGSREGEIAQLNNQAVELRECGQKLLQDRTQLQTDRTAAESELKQVQQRLGQLDKTGTNYRERLDRVNNLIMELQLACERTSKHIGQYEHENNSIDEEVSKLISRESEQNVQLDEINQQLKQLKFELSELDSDQRGLQNALVQGRAATTQEREKTRELNDKLKQKQQLLARLQRQIQVENQQTDFLVRVNGEVAEVNNKIQQDMAMCLRHKEALLRNNQQLTCELECFRKQDRGILQQIQLRSNEALPKAKLDESKLTVASSRIRASRRLQ